MCALDLFCVYCALPAHAVHARDLCPGILGCRNTCALSLICVHRVPPACTMRSHAYSALNVTFAFYVCPMTLRCRTACALPSAEFRILPA